MSDGIDRRNDINIANVNVETRKEAKNVHATELTEIELDVIGIRYGRTQIKCDDIKTENVNEERRYIRKEMKEKCINYIMSLVINLYFAFR